MRSAQRGGHPRHALARLWTPPPARRLNLPTTGVETTGTGAWSVGARTLGLLNDSHPVVPLIAQIK